MDTKKNSIKEERVFKIICDLPFKPGGGSIGYDDVFENGVLEELIDLSEDFERIDVYLLPSVPFSKDELEEYIRQHLPQYIDMIDIRISSID